MENNMLLVILREIDEKISVYFDSVEGTDIINLKKAVTIETEITTLLYLLTKVEIGTNMPLVLEGFRRWKRNKELFNHQIGVELTYVIECIKDKIDQVVDKLVQEKKEL